MVTPLYSLSKKSVQVKRGNKRPLSTFVRFFVVFKENLYSRGRVLGAQAHSNSTWAVLAKNVISQHLGQITVK